jgi:hypothetical protein
MNLMMRVELMKWYVMIGLLVVGIQALVLSLQLDKLLEQSLI